MKDPQGPLEKDLVMLVEFQIVPLVQVLVIWVVMETWMVELEPVVDLDQWVSWLVVEW